MFFMKPRDWKQKLFVDPHNFEELLTNNKTEDKVVCVINFEKESVKTDF